MGITYLWSRQKCQQLLEDVNLEFDADDSILLDSIHLRKSGDVWTDNNKAILSIVDKSIVPSIKAQLNNKPCAPVKPMKQYTIGPGTAIKVELAKWGIHPKEKKCKCNDIAAAMDDLGPDELERNLDLYVAKMRESFKQWRGRVPIPTPPDFILRQIIEYGISTSRASLINY